MIVKEVTRYLESIAPLPLQESYDNSGLIVGDPSQTVDKIIVSLDCVEEVLDEAIAKGAQMIVAHHPIVFSGLKKITGKNYIERTVLKAIKNDIAIYAIHTNLDNVHTGVNREIGSRLGLEDLSILDPVKGNLKKLTTFVPVDYQEGVSNALFLAGAGSIGNYSECSFRHEGVGTFSGGDDTKPFVGEIGKRHHENEYKLEVVVPAHALNNAISAMVKAHPYEEVAYDIYAIENNNPLIGAGMIGTLSEPMNEKEFLNHVKNALKTECIRHTKLLNKPISRVAFCGGSGSFLLNQAKNSGAQVFITGDFKYHQFFDAEGDLIILDVGHFESEQFTIELLSELLKEKFSNIAVLKTEVNTNPISYF